MSIKKGIFSFKTKSFYYAFYIDSISFYFLVKSLNQNFVEIISDKLAVHPKNIQQNTIFLELNKYHLCKQLGLLDPFFKLF